MWRDKEWSLGKILGELDIRWHDNRPSSHDDRDKQLIEAGADAILKALIAKGVISQLSTGYTGAIFALGDNNEWESTSDRALIRKMSESERIAPIDLDKRIGYLVFIPATIEEIGGH